MRYSISGATIGFVRLSPATAEVAYNITELTSLPTTIVIENETWKVQQVNPSKYVKNTMVASLWKPQ